MGRTPLAWLASRRCSQPQAYLRSNAGRRLRILRNVEGTSAGFRLHPALGYPYSPEMPSEHSIAVSACDLARRDRRPAALCLPGAPLLLLLRPAR